MVKTCNKCGQDKELTLFAKGAKYKDGYRNTCKRCHTDYVNLYYKNNPDKAQAKRKMNTYYKPNWKRHHLSEEAYLELLNKYQGRCHSCQVRPATDIDHNHSCCSNAMSCGSCVRGILCAQCNTALGLLQDNRELISKLLAYSLQS